jgi:signal transduction histidine kinase
VAVERARALLQWKIEAKHLSLEVALDEDLPMLAADPDQLQQVLVNLLLNACDASDEGGAVRVEARVDRPAAGGPPRTCASTSSTAAAGSPPST